MYHLVYKIVNTLNNQYYIGIHSTSNIDDGYMGSGNLIKKAILEYGAENFDRYILHSFSTRKEAIQKEAELVTIESLSDPLCYNLVLGGCTMRTTAERRELFSRNAREVIDINPASRYNPVYKYSFKPIKTYEFSCDDNACGLEKAAVEIFNHGFEKVLFELSKLFNSKRNNRFAVVQLRKFSKYFWYKNNIKISVEKWNDLK